MKILHITSHLGGGVGTVVMDWIEKVKGIDHTILCLDSINEKAQKKAADIGLACYENMKYSARMDFTKGLISEADVVLVHFWDHPLLYEFLTYPLPACRMIFWCHKNYPVPAKYVEYPDMFVDTSPIQGHGKHIWSTGNMSRFSIGKKTHEGFNVGYIGTVDYKKLHPDYIEICKKIANEVAEVRFIIIGENNIKGVSDNLFTFTGKVDDIAPYLPEMDVLGYPLQPDHYGTCEQVIGEASAAGVVPVVMNNMAERNIIRDKINGFIAKDPEEYIDIITTLGRAKKYELANVQSSFARWNARTKYSIANMISQWENTFTEISNNPKTMKWGVA